MQRLTITALGTLFVSGLTMAPVLPAQEEGDPQQTAFIESRTEKLASEFLKKAEWFTDFDKAKAAAEKSGKKIFAYFTRSYSP